MAWIHTNSQESFISASCSVMNIKLVVLMKLANLHYVKTEKVVISTLNFSGALEKDNF